jgi:hypothetical protein
MKYFLDTEFIENPNTITLISIGIVCEDGRSLYRICNEYRYKDASDWVKENVIIPMYVQTVHGDNRNMYSAESFHQYYGKSIRGIKDDIIEFVKGDEEIEFYGYFADYDWVVFCWIFGRMIDLPKGFPFYCRDLKQMMDERGFTKEWKQQNCPDPKGEHNALVDAKWNYELFKKLNSEPNPERSVATKAQSGNEKPET